MGIFGSLIDGISSAASWAMAHSGQIIGVAKAVAGVAGLALPLAAESGLEAVEVDENNPVVGYHDNFVLANKHIVDRAQDFKGEQDVSLMVLDDEKKLKEYTTSGLWSTPATSDSRNFLPPPDMYRDLSTWLGQHGVPPTFTSGAKETHDTAQFVGQAIFANAPVGESEIAKPSDRITEQTFHLAPLDKSWGIGVKHAYYALPMGKAGSENTWHSAMHFKLATTKTHREQEKQVTKHLRLLATQDLIVAPQGDQWMVTLRIIWASASMAEALRTKFLTTFKDSYGPDPPRGLGARVVINELNGPTHTWKVSVPLSITPAAVRAAVATTAITVSGSAASSSQYPVAPANQPEVCVTDASIAPATSSTGSQKLPN